MAVTGSKLVKEQRRWSEVRKRKPLNEDIEDDRSARKMDQG
jgi:hypothetical protein